MAQTNSGSGFWGFLGSIGNNITTAVQNEKTREYNLRLAKMQNQWNIDQWMRENQYNTPAAQQDRLAAGGLNPDLMYQNGAAGLMSADSPEMTAGAPADPIPYNPIDVQNLINADKLTKAEVDRKSAEAEYYRSEAKGNEIENEFKPHLLAQKVKMNDVEIELKQAYKLESQAQANHFNKLCEEITQGIKESEKRIEEIGSRISLNASQESLNLWHRNLTQKQYQYFEKEFGLKQSQVDYLGQKVRAYVDLCSKQGSKMSAEQQTEAARKLLIEAQTVLFGNQNARLVLENNVFALKGMDLAEAEEFQRRWGSITAAVITLAGQLAGLFFKGGFFDAPVGSSNPGDPGYLEPSDFSGPTVPWN